MKVKVVVWLVRIFLFLFFSFVPCCMYKLILLPSRWTSIFTNYRLNVRTLELPVDDLTTGLSPSLFCTTPLNPRRSRGHFPHLTLHNRTLFFPNPIHLPNPRPKQPNHKMRTKYLLGGIQNHWHTGAGGPGKRFLIAVDAVHGVDQGDAETCCLCGAAEADCYCFCGGDGGCEVG